MSVFSKIGSYFNQIDRLRSIQLNIDEQGQVGLSDCVLSLKKGEIVLEKKDEIEEEHLNKLPVVVTVDGKGILHRAVNQILQREQVSNVFPSVKIEEFYIQHYTGATHTHFALVRTSQLEELLARLSVDQNQIIGIYLGAFAAGSLAGLEGFPEQVGRFQFHIKNGELVNLQVGSEAVARFSFWGYSVDKNLQLAFISGMDVLLKGFNAFNFEPFKNRLEEFNYKKKVKVVGLGALAFFMGLLMLSFLLLSVVGKKASALAGQNAQKSAQLVELNQLEGQLSDNQQFVSALGLQQKKNHAFLLDQVGKSVPSSIQLNSFEINPGLKAVKQEKEILYENGAIVISGFAQKSVELNEWKKTLANMDWVKKAALQDYFINKEGKGEFTIKLEYN